MSVRYRPRQFAVDLYVRTWPRARESDWDGTPPLNARVHLRPARKLVAPRAIPIALCASDTKGFQGT